MAPDGEFADSQIAEWLRSLPETYAEMDIAATRRSGEETARSTPAEPEMREVTDIRIDGIAARLYKPTLQAAPLILYLHGGGWSIGSIATHDHIVRRLAHRSGAMIVSLDYRLAPEHPWPASVDDAATALSWLAEHRERLGAVGRTGIAGDSAGGTLATLACIRVRDASPEALPGLQVLLYPNTDLTGSQPSMREKATGYGLTADGVQFFNRQWVSDEALWSDPRVSPLFTPDLTGMPPALIVTAEHDPLRDEGERYAERLQAAGVAVTLRREHGLVHSFMGMDRVSPASAAAADHVADDVRALLAD